MESIYLFNVISIIVLLTITLISSILPVILASAEGETRGKKLISEQLPFLTAGVFLGAGLLHLIPDSIETYESINEYEDDDSDGDDYPLMFLLAAIGCSVVFFIDLLQVGSSEKMMAVAAAAQPKKGASICHLRIPSMATYGTGEEKREMEDENTPLLQMSFASMKCCCDEVPSIAHDLISTVLQAGATRMRESGRSSETFNVDVLLKSIENMEITTLPHSRVEQPTVSRQIVFSGESSLMPYLLAALFSVHSFMAGLALGVSPELDNAAIATSIAIISHKVIEAMAVGANFAKENVPTRKSLTVIIFYSIMTPLGIILGMVLTSTLTCKASLYAQSFAMAIGGGSFLYLSFHEMSDEHASKEASITDKISYFTVGLTSMALLAYWA